MFNVNVSDYIKYEKKYSDELKDTVQLQLTKGKLKEDSK